MSEREVRYAGDAGGIGVTVVGGVGVAAPQCHRRVGHTGHRRRSDRDREVERQAVVHRDRAAGGGIGSRTGGPPGDCAKKPKMARKRSARERMPKEKRFAFILGSPAGNFEEGLAGEIVFRPIFRQSRMKG